MIAPTLPVGISPRQYPWVIYPLVHENDNARMGREEHWRQRLLELKEDLGLTQVALAEAMKVDASYMSRLLYPPGKKGRKNLGLDTMRACREAYALPADWFDRPLGSALPSGQKGMEWKVSEPEPASVIPLPKKFIWPFKQVTYRRLMDLRAALGPRTGADAMGDIDALLDIAVTKWERLASKKKSVK